MILHRLSALRAPGGYLAAGILAAAFAVPAHAADPQVTIKFPVEYNADVTPGIANQEFIKLVEERSGGAIKAELYPSGSLYKGLDALQAVLRGDAEMTTLVSAYWTAISPKLAVFELPYAFPTHESFYRATENDEFMRSIFSDIEDKGGRVIAVLPYDYLFPGNTERPTIMPKDFEGLKLRALGKTNARTLETLGASAVPINITEVAGALERGVIDGLNTPADAFVSYKWDDTIKYVNKANYFFAFYPWVVNAQWWEGLSEEHRKLIHDTAVEVATRHRERARQAADEALKKIADAGVQLHEQTPEEAEVWREAVQSVWTKAEEAYGKEVVNSLRAASGTNM